MLSLSEYKGSLIAGGKADPSSGAVVPIKPSTQSAPVDPVAQYEQALKAVPKPQEPSAPAEEQSTLGKIGSIYGDLAKKTGKVAIAIPKFLTSSEQKLGGIIGDSAAGVEESAAQNKVNTTDMQIRMHQQIAQDKAAGKDTSHLEWALAQSKASQPTVDQEITANAPGSKATNEEAAGAIAGTALDLALAGGVGGEVASGVSAGDKTIGEIVKDTGKAALKGAGIGGTYGVAQGMQDNGDSGDLVARGATGAAIGAALPIVAGTYSVGKQFFKPSEVRALTDYRSTIEGLLGQKESGVKAMSKAEKMGSNPVDLFVNKAKNGDAIPMNTRKVGGKLVNDTDEAVQKLWDDVNKLNDIQRPALAASPERVPLDTVRKQVLARLKSDMGGSANYGKAQSQVNEIFNGLKAAPDFQKGALRLDQLDDIKSDQWMEARSLFTKTQRPDFAGNVHYQIGSTIRDVIEEKLPDAPVRALNQLVGQHLETIQQLEKLNGSTVKYGMMGKHFMRTIGAIAGSHAGPGGTIGGAMAGNKMSEILAEFGANNPYRMKVIEGLEGSDPKIVQEFSDFLERSLAETNGGSAVKLPSNASSLVTDLRLPKEGETPAPTKLNIRDINAEREAAWAAKQAKEYPKLQTLQELKVEREAEKARLAAEKFAALQAKELPPLNPLKKQVIPVTGSGGLMNKPS